MYINKSSNLKIFIFVVLISMYQVTLLNGAKNISVIGTGYVGLVLGACLASFDNNVICADIDQNKIDLLKRGIMTIYEPGLSEMVDRVVKNRTLTFTSSIETAIQQSQIIFIAVGTPMDEKGQADISAIENVAKVISQNLNGYKIICTKSTVPIGTGKLIKNIISKHSNKISNFDIASNPEFLKEGTAVTDFLDPNRVIIGAESEEAFGIMKEIYQPIVSKGVPLLCTDIVTAEAIKYASNSFLAIKISYINEVANLCEATGADVSMVAQGMGLDNRIGLQFLKPGPGFGGSCFPKDAEAFLYTARSTGEKLRILKAALKANEIQKLKIFNKLQNLLENNLKEKTIGILGLAFKANTDDVRYSPAIPLIEKAIEKGAIVKAYDPIAMSNMKKLIKNITYCNSLDEAVIGADALVILTEWEEFKHIDLAKMRGLMRQPIILDARNIINTKMLSDLGFIHSNIGNAKVLI